MFIDTGKKEKERKGIERGRKGKGRETKEEKLKGFENKVVARRCRGR